MPFGLGKSVGALLMAVAALIMSVPAGAQQYQYGAVHQSWTLPELAWNVDTYIWPSLLSPAIFFTQQFEFNGGGLAYMGLQQGAAEFGNENERQVRFSIWDATDTRRSRIPGAGCRDFGGEGVGKTCTIPYAFRTGRWYRLRIWLLNDTNDTSHGRWWGAWVIDDAGNESHVGDILAPRGNDLITWVLSFNEYFGTSVGYPCGQLPPSTVYFYQPILNDGDYRATIDSSNTAECSAGRVTPLWDGTLSKLELNYQRVGTGGLGTAQKMTPTGRCAMALHSASRRPCQPNRAAYGVDRRERARSLSSGIESEQAAVLADALATEERREEMCPRKTACGPVDKSPAFYRQRASSRLYKHLPTLTKTQPHFRRSERLAQPIAIAP